MKPFYLFVAALICAEALSAQPVFNPAADQRAEELLSKMTLDEKLAYIGGVAPWYIRPVERLDIPRIVMSDGPQGVGNAWTSTAYPCALMLAATWNPDLAVAYGEGLGRDSRSRGIHFILGPAVNIYRSPLCGRNFEYMGEDPYLASQIAVGYILGVQSHGVSATVKHFAANNSEPFRTTMDSRVDERTLNEIYFPAFKAAVQQGNVGAVMTSYNRLNGVYTNDSPWLLGQVLRAGWGFRGLVMSDWGAVKYAVPVTRAGMDLEMPSGKHMNPKDLKYYLETGDITVEMIDDKVRNILRTLAAFGFLDAQQKRDDIPGDDPRSVQTALKVAEEGLVLLKNEGGILPFNPHKIKTIAVVGEAATRNNHGGGSGRVRPYHFTTTLEGLQAEGARRGVKVEFVDRRDYITPILFTSADKKEQGLRGEYFDNKELHGAPKATRTDRQIEFRWSAGPNAGGIGATDFSVRWKGVLCPQHSGDHQFDLMADDGCRLYLDGEMVIEDWKEGGPRNHRIERHLEAGKAYPVVVEFFQSGSDAVANFSVLDISAGSDAVPAQYLARLRAADAVVVCFGFKSDSEGEGSDRSYALPEAEHKALMEALKCGKPVVGVGNSGGSLDMDDWEPGLKALLWAWYPGQEGGTAIAQALFGAVNPSGKLPVTFEKRLEDNPAYGNFAPTADNLAVDYTEGIFTGYRGFDKSGREVRYPFGYGLSYTTFALSGMEVKTLPDGRLEVSFSLRNTGSVKGAQVVQLYVNKGDKYVENPEKELKGFKKIELAPGQSVKSSIVIAPDAFSWYDVAAKDFVTKPGEYGVMLGFSSRDIKASGKVTIL